jgi:hypothetical protein
MPGTRRMSAAPASRISETGSSFAWRRCRPAGGSGVHHVSRVVLLPTPLLGSAIWELVAAALDNADGPRRRSTRSALPVPATARAMLVRRRAVCAAHNLTLA